jgi:hypothetical protein
VPIVLSGVSEKKILPGFQRALYEIELIYYICLRPADLEPMDICWDSDDDAEYEMVMIKNAEGANKKILYEEEDEDMTEDGKANYMFSSSY